MGKPTSELKLGTGGLTGRAGEVQAVQQVDPGRGWQLCTSFATAQAALTNLTDAASDVVVLPPEGRNIDVRCLLDTNGAGAVATVEVYLWPLDPGTDSTDDTKNDSDGNAAGETVRSYTFTGSTTKGQTRIGTTAVGYQSDVISLDRKGYAKMAARVTTYSTTTAGDVVYRLY